MRADCEIRRGPHVDQDGVPLSKEPRDGVVWRPDEPPRGWSDQGCKARSAGQYTGGRRWQVLGLRAYGWHRHRQRGTKHDPTDHNRRGISHHG